MTDARRQALEEPDVRDGRGQLDMAHPLAADLRFRHLDTALVADDAAVLHPLVLAAQAFPVGDRTEDLRAEEPVALRLERPVVDRLRLGDFAVRPRPDLLRGCERDLDGVEIVDRLGLGRLKQCVEDFPICASPFTGCRCLLEILRVLRMTRASPRGSIVGSLRMRERSLTSLPKHSQQGASHSWSPVWKCTVMRIAPNP